MIPQRILDKVEPVTESGCWIWTASENGKGYGHNKENVLCGETLPAVQLRRDTCNRGHRYEGHTRNDNSRHCKICRNALQKVKYHERKLAALGKRKGGG